MESTWISETLDRESFMLGAKNVENREEIREKSNTCRARSEVAGISRLRLSFFLPTNNGRELLVIQHKL